MDDLAVLCCAVVAALAATVQTAAQSGPIPSTFFAMSAVRADDYPKLTIGTLAHQEFAWVTIERSRGNFNFQTFDQYMAAAQQHGLVDPATNIANFAMTLAAGTPSWALADHSSCASGTGTVSCTAAPDNIQDWKDFISAVVQHYNGKARPHIRYYELWNEANVSKWWTGTDAQLVALAQAAYPIIHQDPYSLLLTPSVAGPVGNASPESGTTWMSGYLQAGGAKYADGGAFHGYLGAQAGLSTFPMPEEDSTSSCKAFVGCYGSIITKATQMRAVFDQNGLAGKPMYQTEGSWGNNTVTDPDTQVAWLARFNLLQAGLRSTLNLQMAAWFTWAAPSFGWGTIETDAGDPTAAGLAYNQVFNWVAGASIDQPCSGAANGTWTCTLTRDGGYTAQAVWNTKGSLSYTPGRAYTQYRDLAGKLTPLAPGAAVTIGAKPILVEQIPPAAPGCTYALSPGGQTFSAAGGSGSIGITAPAGCAWSVSAAPAWVSFTSATTGSGNGSVSYTVGANSGGDQTATLTVAGQPFTVEQETAAISGAGNAGTLAQIATGQGWDTAIELINLGAAPAPVRVSFFADSSGSPLQLPLSSPGGPLMAATLDRTLNPNALLALDTNGAAGQNASAGWVQLQAAGSVAGYGLLTNAAANWEAVVPLETRNAQSYLLAFDNTGSIATGAAIANLSAQAANVNVILRDATGAQLGDPQTIALAGQGHALLMLNTAYPATAGITGTMEFDTPAGGQISVLGLRMNGAALTTLPVLANAAAGTGSLSHIAFNAGWQTAITLVNTDSMAAQPTLSFYDDNGNPLAAPLVNEQTGEVTSAATLTPALAPGQMVTYQTQGQDGQSAMTGSAVLATTGSVSGLAILQEAGQETAVPLETRNASSFVLGYDNTNGQGTELAVANPTGQAANLTVTVRDNQGAVLQSGAIGLAAYGHAAVALATGYAASAGQQGTVEVDGPAGFSVAGLLMTPTGNVATLPAFTPPSNPPKTAGPPLAVPASGAYLGIWANPALGSTAEAAIEAREGPAPNGINHRLALHLHYYAWSKIAAMLNNGIFQPDAALAGDIAHGRVPVISWVCEASMPNSDHVIASGDANQDAIITATARALAQYPGPVLLRWFWEFNVLGNNQTCRGDTGERPTQQVYADFVGAWRRIRQLFQNAGANNVSFLWNPGHYTADGNADDPHGFYPGNEYVDWIGVDTYQDNTSATFATNMEPFYSDFSQPQYAGKPLMVGENGSQNWAQHNQEFQAPYLQGILTDFRTNMFPRIKAYCYFDSTGTHGVWVLDDNNGQGKGGLAAFAAMAASPEFSPPAITPMANPRSR